MSGGASPDADRAVAADAAEPVVSALRASIPSAEWPCWAAVGTFEDFRCGALCTVTNFSWLFAPTEADAEAGARRMLRDANPDARCVEVFVREVPAQAIEARRAETGTGYVHESAVAESDAPQGGPHEQAL